MDFEPKQGCDGRTFKEKRRTIRKADILRREDKEEGRRKPWYYIL